MGEKPAIKPDWKQLNDDRVIYEYDVDPDTGSCYSFYCRIPIPGDEQKVYFYRSVKGHPAIEDVDFIESVFRFVENAYFKSGLDERKKKYLRAFLEAFPRYHILADAARRMLDNGKPDRPGAATAEEVAVPNPLKERDRAMELTKERIISEYRSGKTQMAAALSMGMDPKSLRSFIRKYGMALPRWKKRGQKEAFRV